MEERRDKINYYLDVAEVVSCRSTCIRRHFGAVIVKDDKISATGYTGSPKGRANCSDLEYCLRNKLNVPRGERYELCRSVHAEANAIIQCDSLKMEGAVLYLVGLEATGNYVEGAEPCSMCKRMILNSGISTVIVRVDNTSYRCIDVNSWVVNDESLEGLSTY